MRFLLNVSFVDQLPKNVAKNKFGYCQENDFNLFRQCLLQILASVMQLIDGVQNYCKNGARDKESKRKQVEDHNLCVDVGNDIGIFVNHVNLIQSNAHEDPDRCNQELT
jgi:hypothetical protein